ncbi:hypothetical protein HKX48_001089 [Thoreauomyces humboldtii]|nr:hypothetical protein HKX48_001089 [Thoreauomyces humboldtii]
MRSKLGLVTRAFFEQKDFSKLEILQVAFPLSSSIMSNKPLTPVFQTLYENLVSSVSGYIPDSTLYMEDMSMNQQLSFEGSDDDIRARFEAYLQSMLASVKTAQTAAISVDPAVRGKDFIADFNPLWVRSWQSTIHYNKWLSSNGGELPETLNVNPAHPCQGASAFGILQTSIAARFSDFGKSLSPVQQNISKAVESSISRAETTITKAVETVSDPQQQQKLQAGASQVFSNVSFYLTKKRNEWNDSPPLERKVRRLEGMLADSERSQKVVAEWVTRNLGEKEDIVAFVEFERQTACERADKIQKEAKLLEDRNAELLAKLEDLTFNASSPAIKLEVTVTSPPLDSPEVALAAEPESVSRDHHPYTESRSPGPSCVSPPRSRVPSPLTIRDHGGYSADEYTDLFEQFNAVRAEDHQAHQVTSERLMEVTAELTHARCAKENADLYIAMLQAQLEGMEEQRQPIVDHAAIVAAAASAAANGHENARLRELCAAFEARIDESEKERVVLVKERDDAARARDAAMADANAMRDEIVEVQRSQAVAEASVEEARACEVKTRQEKELMAASLRSTEEALEASLAERASGNEAVAELRSQHVKSEARIQLLGAESLAKDGQVETLVETLRLREETTQTELALAHATLDQLQEALRRLEDRVLVVQSNTEVRSKLHQVEQEYAALTKVSKESEMASQLALDARDAKIQGLERSVATLEADLENARQEHAITNDSLALAQAKVLESTELASSSIKQLAESKAKGIVASAKLEERDTLIASLRQTNITLEEQLDLAQAAAGASMQLEQAHATLVETLKNTEEKLRLAEETLGATSDKLTEVQQAKACAEQQLQEVERAKLRGDQQLAELESAQSLADQQLSSYELDKSNLERELAEMKQTTATRHSELESALETAREAAQSAEAQASEARAALAHTSMELKDLRFVRDTLKDDLDELEGVREQLTASASEEQRLRTQRDHFRIETLRLQSALAASVADMETAVDTSQKRLESETSILADENAGLKKQLEEEIRARESQGSLSSPFDTQMINVLATENSGLKASVEKLTEEQRQLQTQFEVVMVDL